MARNRMLLCDSLEPHALAEMIKLRYVSDDMPGYTRRRAGSGVMYLDCHKQHITNEKTLRRIHHLVIPPAWKQVWICPYSNGHIQATGRDAKGRKQYIYHQRWQKAANLVKFCKMQHFGALLPDLRRIASRELGRGSLDQRYLLAGLVLLLDATSIRIGNEEYVKENSSYGLTTLRCRHVKVNGESFEFCFRGKSGLQKRLCIHDKRLTQLIGKCTALNGSRVFKYLDPITGKPKPIESFDVNHYIQEVTGHAFTAKDFRTWKASSFIAGRLYEYRDVDRITMKQRIMRLAVRETAEQLGNTPTVCRHYYIHPGLLDTYRDGSFAQIFHGFTPKPRKLLHPEEQILAHFLERWQVQPVEQILTESQPSAA